MLFIVLLLLSINHQAAGAESPVPTHCGRGRYHPEKRIVGGQASRSGEWPWLVSVMIPVAGGKQAHMCGGTLISPEWVISAAHCFESLDNAAASAIPEDNIIRIGEHNLYEDDVQHVDIIPSKIILHNRYDSRYLMNDLALIKLSKPVTLNDRVNVACLPERYEVLPTKCTVAGWGYTDLDKTKTGVVRHVEVDIFRTTRCLGLNDPAHICAGHTGVGYKGSCSGDSGGPLVCFDEAARQWILAGVVSSGLTADICDSATDPGLYSRVSHYLTWIEYIIATN